jgi:hypothetical protein
LLGTAGVPPLRIERLPISAPLTFSEIAAATRGSATRPPCSGNGTNRVRSKASTSAASAATKPGDASENDAIAAAPLRRRSWQQIGRMLEIEEARREREHAAQVAEIRARWTAENSDAAAEPLRHGES